MGALEAPIYATADGNRRAIAQLSADTQAGTGQLSAALADLAAAENTHAAALTTTVTTARDAVQADVAAVAAQVAQMAQGAGNADVLARLNALFCDVSVDEWLSAANRTSNQADEWLANTANAEAFARSVRAPYGLTYCALPAESWIALIGSDTARSLLDANDPGWWRILINNGHVQQAIIASSTAMQAVATSSTAMQAVAASSTAMQALKASPLKQRYTKASTGWEGSSSTHKTIISGRGIFLARYEAYQNGASLPSAQDAISIDGTIIEASKKNLYEHPHVYTSSIGAYWHQAGSYIDYIPL